MRYLFLPACLCLMTLSAASGSDVAGTFKDVRASDRRAVRVADATAGGREENTPAGRAEAPDDSQSGDSAASKPPPQSPGVKPVVQRSRREICDTVVTTARSNDLPLPFFIHLLFQESGFKPDAVSRAGAQGIAQFMPETAETVGLHNPFDPLEAISASARLLGNLLRRFGNLGLAAAAYNAGPQRIQDWLAKKVRLPKETQHYVTTITGRTPESWTARSSDAAAAVVPREAPCQEAIATVAAYAAANRPAVRAAKKHLAGSASAVERGDRKRSPVGAEKSPMMRVTGHVARKLERAGRSADKPVRKERGAIQLAAASKKRVRKARI